MTTQQQLDAALAKIAELESKPARAGKITLKVSAKGAISAYGMGRWPVTLYAPQWVKLLDIAVEIRKFIDDNKAKLSMEKPAAVVPPQSPAVAAEDSTRKTLGKF